MTIESKVIEDSISNYGVRLTTLQIKYPRFIHSEFNTHRTFSKNASSSRAIPVEKMIQAIIDDCAMPVRWGKNQPGMQAYEDLNPLCEAVMAEQIWLEAMDDAVRHARRLVNLGAHKQIVNRILEPFAHISVIVTATEWDNFFALRDHHAADPTIQELARAMKHSIEFSEPVERHDVAEFTSNWHLPYITEDERDAYHMNPKFLARISAARCARVSYLTHDGTKPEIDKDLALYNRLVGSIPRHSSPVEHSAFPLHGQDIWSNNFKGWQQFRELVDKGLV